MTPMLSPGNTSLSILQKRPRAMEIFVRLQLNPWRFPDLPLEMICREKRIDPSEVMAEILDLPPPPSAGNWRTLPLSHLLDKLCADHRRFIENHAPQIELALADARATARDEAEYLRALQEGWRGFAALLINHVQDEETILYPHILRLAHPFHLGPFDEDPKSHSLQQHLVIHELNKEGALIRAARNLGRLLDSSPTRPSPWPVDKIRALLRHLDKHIELEKGTLQPMALALEKAVFDRAISGGVPVPG